MAETITIEHERWGRVEGVELYGSNTTIWCKNGAVYIACDGWREVPKTKWVPVQLNEYFNGGDYTSVGFGVGSAEYTFRLPSGYRWRKVEIEKEVDG